MYHYLTYFTNTLIKDLTSSNMKTLNEKTAKEIGFNLDCLPYWYNHIFMNSHGEWHLIDDLDADRCDYDANEINHLTIYSNNSIEIPERFEPTNFKGEWDESLFEIKRSPEWLKKNDPVMYKALFYRKRISD